MLLLSFWETKEREKGTEVIGKLVNSGDDAKRKTVVPRSLARPAERALLPDSIRSMDDGERVSRETWSIRELTSGRSLSLA